MRNRSACMRKTAGGSLLGWLQRQFKTDEETADSLVRWGGTGLGAVLGYLLSDAVHRKPSGLTSGLYALAGGLAGNRLSDRYVENVRKRLPRTAEGDLMLSSGKASRVNVSPLISAVKDNPRAADSLAAGALIGAHSFRGGAKAWDNMVSSTGMGRDLNPGLDAAPSASMSGITNPLSGISTRLAMAGKGKLIRRLAAYNQARARYHNLKGTGAPQSSLDALDSLMKSHESALKSMAGSKYALNLEAGPGGPQVIAKDGTDVVRGFLNNKARRGMSGLLNTGMQGTLAGLLASLVSPGAVSDALDWVPGLQTREH